MFPVEKMKDSQNEMYVLVFITCLIPLLGPADGCNPLACPRLSCSGPVKLPGQCCPYCPCKYDGIYYNVGMYTEVNYTQTTNFRLFQTKRVC